MKFQPLFCDLTTRRAEFFPFSPTGKTALILLGWPITAQESHVRVNRLVSHFWRVTNEEQLATPRRSSRLHEKSEESGEKVASIKLISASN